VKEESTRDPGTSRAEKLRRRARSVPLVLLASLLATVLLPVLLLGASVYDVTRLPRGGPRWVACRLVAFGWVFLLADAVGILALAAIWLASGGGAGRGRERMIAWTYAVQRAWTGVMLNALRRLFRLRFEVEGDDVIEPGPVVVLIRHASIVDNLLPANFVTAPHDLPLRYVLKRELLAEPCLDIAGCRLPNAFVARDGAESAAARARIKRLAAGLRGNEGMLIYPEGTRFTPERRERAIARLRDSGHEELARRSEGIAHLLPPRTGGVITLLEALPAADVLVCAHVGLDGLRRVREILAGGLVGTTVRLRITRIARADVPNGDAQRVAWVYDTWAAMDRWIAAQRAGTPGARA
jgi:1-acyl-sn-glycerol-3-phosphate acyltransferase